MANGRVLAEYYSLEYKDSRELYNHGNIFHLEVILLQSIEGFDVICIVLENNGKLAGVNLLFLITKNKIEMSHSSQMKTKLAIKTDPFLVSFLLSFVDVANSSGPSFFFWQENPLFSCSFP